MKLPSELFSSVTDGFIDLMGREGWGNAGDVKVVYEKMLASKDSRFDENDGKGLTDSAYNLEDVAYAFAKMKEQRRLLPAASLKKPSFQPPIAPTMQEETPKHAPAVQETVNVVEVDEAFKVIPDEFEMIGMLIISNPLTVI